MKKIQIGKRISLSFSNRWLYTFIAIGIIAIIGVGVYALAPSIDTSKGYHESTQISVDIGGTEKTLQEAIVAGDLSGGTVDTRCDTSGTCSQVCIGTNCQTSWPSGGGSLWSQSGSNIYYNNGNVGIGTTTSSAKLSVGGDRGSPNEAIYAKSDHTAIFGDGKLYGVIGSGSNAGVMGQGYTCDFDAVGPGTNYCASSSIRWKKNIRSINNALDKVLNIRGVYFNWDEEHGGQHDMGMVAEEVGEYIPEVVVYEEDGIYAKSIDYGALTPILVEAIKELKAEKDAEIEALKQRIAELEKENN